MLPAFCDTNRKTEAGRGMAYSRSPSCLVAKPACKLDSKGLQTVLSPVSPWSVSGLATLGA